MTERARELVEMLTILKDKSGSLKLLSARDYTIVMDCKKESFDFVIDQAVAYIRDQEAEI